MNIKIKKLTITDVARIALKLSRSTSMSLTYWNGKITGWVPDPRLKW